MVLKPVLDSLQVDLRRRPLAASQPGQSLIERRSVGNVGVIGDEVAQPGILGLGEQLG